MTDDRTIMCAGGCGMSYYSPSSLFGEPGSQYRMYVKKFTCKSCAPGEWLDLIDLACEKVDQLDSTRLTKNDLWQR